MSVLERGLGFELELEYELLWGMELELEEEYELLWGMELEF